MALSPVFRRHALCVALLVLIATGVQAIAVVRATLPSLDAVRLIRYARAIEQDPIGAIRAHGEQPLYPAAVAAAHCLLDRLIVLGPGDWMRIAQGVAAAMVVLSAIAVYALVARLTHRRAGLVAGLLFCVLPEAARLGPDALSDSTHLLLLCLGLGAIVAALLDGSRSGRWLLAAGLAAGLAVTARAESLVLIAVAVPFLLCQAAWKVGSGARALKAAGRSIACLGVGFAVPVIVYLGVSGAYAPRSAVARLLGRATAVAAHSAALPDASPTDRGNYRLPDGRALTLSKKDHTRSIRRPGAVATLARVGDRLLRAFGYWLVPLALWGAWRWRREPPFDHTGEAARRETSGADRFLQLFFFAYLTAITLFVLGEGYVEGRHLLPAVVAAFGCVADGVERLAAKVAALKIIRPVAIVTLLLLLAMAPRALRPLHASRLGHRLAADWLVQHARDDDGKDRRPAVVDTRGWTALQTGLPTYPLDRAAPLLADRRLRFVVLEKRERLWRSPRAETLRHLLAVAGRHQVTLPGPADSSSADLVEVYRWDADAFARHQAAAARPASSVMATR